MLGRAPQQIELTGKGRSTNQYRLAHPPMRTLDTIYVLPFTADQLARDAVRAYNGFGCGNCGQYGLAMHEYQLSVQVLEGTRVLDVDNERLESGLWVGDARWVVVPVADRQGPGDHDYVNHVFNRDPLCP